MHAYSKLPMPDPACSRRQPPMISQAEGDLDSRSSEEPVHEIGRLKASHEGVAQISLGV